MNSNEKLLIAALKGTKGNKIPFWFMRQAGRYLPEYRELRSKAKNFLDFCYTPELACEVTLQPIRRFDMSAAIIFSDILVIPHALGMRVWFEEGNGPRLAPVNEESFSELAVGGMKGKLSPVYEALRLTKKSLPKETALIGFCGAPWTLACYMLNGRGGDFSAVKAKAGERKEFFLKLLSLLSKAVTEHAIHQIEAGAEVIQLFDSWAGILNDGEFSEYVIAPTKNIVAAIKVKHPNIPIIGFPREAKNNYSAYAKETKVDAVSVDQSVPLEKVKELQKICVVQGNLDPVLLAGDKETMLAQAENIVSALADKAFVFNLGHGILPQTPVENVRLLSDFLRNR